MHPDEISFEKLPVFPLDEVRERIRAGEELGIGHAALRYLATDDPNILTTLREFSAQEIVVTQHDTIIGRLEMQTPTPLPEYADRILTLCTGHIQEIRTRCNAILRAIAERGQALEEHPSQQLFFHHITTGARLVLVNVELSIQRIRNGLEAALYSEFVHDIFHEEEFLTRVEAHVHEQYEQEKQLLRVLEAPLGLPSS